MKYSVYNSSGEEVKKVELNSAIFEVAVNEGLVHQAAMAQMANARQVIAHTKDKSEVRGGGRKPWRQKGTGRARHGSIRSPLWKGGGVTFGPTNDRNFEEKINKKMKRKALFMCLSDRAADKSIILLDKLELGQVKTKEMNKLLRGLVEKLFGEKELEEAKQTEAQDSRPKTGDSKKAEGQDSRPKKKEEKLSVLVVGSKDARKLARAGRNIPKVRIVGADSLNVVDILAHKYLVMDESGLKTIDKVYLKS